MRPNRRVTALLLGPVLLALVVGVIIPGLILLVYSFFTFRLRRIRPGVSLDSYLRVLSESAYRTFALNTLAIAVPVAILATLGGFVLAHHIAFVARRSRNLLLALVAISLLGSYLARVYAWRTVLGSNGLINQVLLALGLVDRPVEALLFTRFAVVVGEVNLLLPLVCLLVYAGLVGIDESLRDSARDLGAGRFEVLRRVTLPLCGPAVLAASSFAFFLSAGDYITPSLLGGIDSTTVGVAISDQVRVTGNLALGSALGVATLLGFALAYALTRAVFALGGLLPRVPAVTS